MTLVFKCEKATYVTEMIEKYFLIERVPLDTGTLNISTLWPFIFVNSLMRQMTLTGPSKDVPDFDRNVSPKNSAKYKFVRTVHACVPGQVEHEGEGEDEGGGDGGHVDAAELDPVPDGVVDGQRADDEVSGQRDGHGGEDGDGEARLQRRHQVRGQVREGARPVPRPQVRHAEHQEREDQKQAEIIWHTSYGT